MPTRFRRVMPWGCDAPRIRQSVGILPAIRTSESAGVPCDLWAQCQGTESVLHVYQHRKGVGRRQGFVAMVQAARSDPHHDQTDSYWLDAFDSIKAVRYGPDYKNVVTPDTQVLTDIANNDLAQVSWVMPHEGASDHGAEVAANSCGPAWVTAIVNAIGESQYWNSTAIIISWDEWGGWFDHVVPPHTRTSKRGVRGSRLSDAADYHLSVRQSSITFRIRSTKRRRHCISSRRLSLGNQTLGSTTHVPTSTTTSSTTRSSRRSSQRFRSHQTTRPACRLQNAGPEIDY